ncbi:MAG: hypothetical protein LH645_08240 [Actinomycetia bacterium]|nr:hypothetical protein [Actinomycetes bacterium]
MTREICREDSVLLTESKVWRVRRRAGCLVVAFAAVLTLSPVPAAVSAAALTASSVVQVAAGERHTCALTVSQSVWCWGANSRGQLGRDDVVQSAEPMLIESVTGVTSMDAGGEHTCAVAGVGNIWCWGANGSGQLGDGTTQDRFRAVRSLVSGATSVSAGRSHTCAFSQGGVNEVQQLRVVASSGSFSLSFEDLSTQPPTPMVTTPALPWDAKPSEVQKALNGLSPLWDVSVWTGGDPHLFGIAFEVGAAAATDVPPLGIDGGGLRGSGAGGQVAEVVNGGQKLLCWGSDTSAQLGRGDIADADIVFSPIQGEASADARGANSIAIDPGGDDLFISESSQKQIWRFTDEGRFVDLFSNLGYEPSSVGVARLDDGLNLFASDSGTSLVADVPGSIWRYSVGDSGVSDKVGWAPSYPELGIPSGSQCDCVVSAMAVNSADGSVLAVISGSVGASPYLTLVRISRDLSSTVRVVDFASSFPAVDDITDVVVGSDASGAPVLYALEKPVTEGDWRISLWDIGASKLALRTSFFVDPTKRGANDPAAGADCPTRITTDPEKVNGEWSKTIRFATYDFGRLGSAFDGDVGVLTKYRLDSMQVQHFVKLTPRTDDGDATEPAELGIDSDGFWQDKGQETIIDNPDKTACVNVFAAGSQSGYGKFVDSYRGDDSDQTSLGGTPTDSVATKDGRLLVVDPENLRVQPFAAAGQGLRGWPSDEYSAVPVSSNPARFVVGKLGSQITGVSAGDGHTCVSSSRGAADPEGPVLCWGSNSAGQLGYLGAPSWIPFRSPNKTDDRTSFPVVVTDPSASDPPTSAPSLEAGLVAAGGEQTCASNALPFQSPPSLVGDAVYCWGSNTFGQLLVPSTDKPEGTAIKSDIANRLLQTGGSATCLVQVVDDEVRCDGPTITDVNGLQGASSLSVGARHVCAVVDGEVYCWGSNETGQSGPEGTGLAISALVHITPRYEVLAPSDLGSTIDVVFEDGVSNVTPSRLVVRDSETALVPTKLSCRDSSGVAVSCVDGVVRTARLRLEDGVTAGETYFVHVNATDELASGGVSVPSSIVEVLAPTDLAENELGPAYSWDRKKTSSAIGGSLIRESARGSSSTFSFTGSSVTWYTVKGPSEGLAEVAIDGQTIRTVDNSASRNSFRVPRAFTSLGAGSHELRITVLGRPGANGRGSSIAVDAFETKTSLERTPKTSMSWGQRSLESGVAGTTIDYAAGATKGSSVAFRFRADTQLEWQTVVGKDQGRANVYIDGTFVATIDNYKSFSQGSATRPTTLTFPVRGRVVHRVKIVALGSGKGRMHLVSIDGMSVS